MPFTNDDSKKLKEINNANRELEGMTVFPVDKIDALLGRLQAAERDRADLLKACEAVDIWFQALCEERAIKARGGTSEGTERCDGEVKRLCEIAGRQAHEVVSRIHQEEAWRKSKGDGMENRR